MNQKSIVALLMLLVVAVMVGVYSNHFENDFHFDDSHTITDNAYIRDLKNIPLFFKDCTTSSSMPSHQGYRPLVTTTLAIDYSLSLKKTKGANGYNPFWYHVSNFTWFVLIVLLLYAVQLKIYRQAFNSVHLPYFAVLGSLWYGLTTANAETVNYIISRSDILSTLAIVSSMAIYLQFEKLRKYYLYLIPAMLGMFAKETTIMFAPALVAYDYLIEKQNSLGSLFTGNGFKRFLSSLAGGLPALIVCVFLAWFTIHMTKQHEPGGTSPLWYALTQPYILFHYVTQFFLPLSLTADTDIPMVTSFSDIRIYGGLLFLAALIGVIFKASEKAEWRPLAYGLVWFLLMLLPTSSFIPLAEVTNDHRVFLPYIGLIIAMVCLLINILNLFEEKKQGQNKYALFLLLAIALTGYGYGTYQRNIVWKTDESLWKDVTEKSPNNGRGWMNYGLTQMGKGAYENARYAFEQALQKTPRYYILHVNLAILNEATGKPNEAETYYKNALVYGPGYVEPYYYYARSLFGKGRTEEAEIYCNKGLSIFAGHLYSRYLLMDIYNKQQNYPKLKEAAQVTLNMYPTDTKAAMYLNIAGSTNGGAIQPATGNFTAVDYLNQSLAFYHAGRYRECIDACYKALALQPNYPEAYNNICSAYNNMNKYDSAAIACQKAIDLRPDFQLAKNNLNWAKSQLKK